MGVLGRLASAVVRRGASLLRREGSDAVRRVPRDVAKRTITRVRPTEYVSPRAGKATPGKPETRFNSQGESSVPGPLRLDMAGRRILPSPTPGGSFGKGGTPAKGAMPGVKKDISTPTSKPASGGVLRRANVVGRRYFTQGTAGSGLNLKRAIPATVATTVPVAIGIAEGINAVKRKVNANAQASQPQQQTQTYQQGADKLAAQSSATATGAVPSSTESSASTDTSPITRSNSTTGVGGLLQDDMRASAAAVRPDRDYMGEAFDATLRKGVTSGRAYLKSQLARDKADVNKTKTTLAAYDKRVSKDTLLGRDRGVGYLKNADSDQTQKDLLAAYRGRFGNYRKNARASEIEAMAQAAAAKRGS